MRLCPCNLDLYSPVYTPNYVVSNMQADDLHSPHCINCCCFAYIRVARPVSLPPQYPQAMIDLGSIAGLHSRNHQLHAYCPTCDRWAVLPLAEMIAAGQGSRRLPLSVRCRWCGTVGRLQVRPPVPTRGPGGWMEPH